MVTWETLRARVGGDSSDASALQSALALAIVLVDEAFSTAWREVPAEVTDECVLRTAQNLFKAADTSDTGYGLLADGVTAAPVSNDPLRKSWPLIRKYVMPL